VAAIVRRVAVVRRAPTVIPTTASHGVSRAVSAKAANNATVVRKVARARGKANRFKSAMVGRKISPAPTASATSAHAHRKHHVALFGSMACTPWPPHWPILAAGCAICY
jgi:hypothetical protein